MLHMKMQLHATVFCYTRVRRKYTDVSLSRDGSKLDFIIRLCRRSFFLRPSVNRETVTTANAMSDRRGNVKCFFSLIIRNIVPNYMVSGTRSIECKYREVSRV